MTLSIGEEKLEKEARRADSFNRMVKHSDHWKKRERTEEKKEEAGAMTA